METTNIDSEINSLYTAALAQHPPVKVAATSVAGTTGQTVRVDLYSGPHGSGFQVVGEIVIGGYTARRVRQAGPETTRDKAWPADIEASAAQWVKDSVAQAFAWTDAQGFSADHKVTLLNRFIVALAAAGSQESLATAKPKLVAVYGWFETVQTLAMEGKCFFPVAPHTFEEVLSE